MTDTSYWSQIVEHLRPQLNPQTVQTWLRPTYQVEQSNSHLTVSVPTAEFRAFIEDTFHDQIADAIASLKLPFREIRYATAEELEPPESAEAIDARAAEEKAEREAEETARLAAQPSECPMAPEAAWHQEARRYRELLKESSEASDNFHLACLINACGAALSKSVYFMLDRQTFPNCYTVIVGDSSWSNKGGAVRFAEDLAFEISPNITPIYSLDSAEGLADKIQQSVAQSEAKKRASVLILIDEFNAFLNKASQKGSKLIPDVKRWFDSPRVLQVNTRHGAVNVENPPAVCLLASSETEDLADMDKRDIRGGLGNRITYVPGSPKALNSRVRRPDRAGWDRLVGDLSSTMKFWHERGSTELRWSAKAQSRWDKFYSSIRQRGGDDPLVGALAARHRVYVVKVAMIYAGLDRSFEIREDHLEAAIAWCDFLLEGLRFIFRGLGLKPWVKESVEIVDYVKRQGGAVEMRKLRRRFHRLGPETFERYMRSLLADQRQPERELVEDPRLGRAGRYVNWVCLNPLS
ncbi:MAG TPA: DUF3987 domain-containing protein [Candidatus Acidoferrales bacterium]|nr:DUF3987 domain-containing protein [Candidatus Acidoferrales bacterium]